MSDLAPTQPATSAYHFPDFSKPPFAGAPEAHFEPLPADGVLPEGFFSTSNLPTYIKLNGRWTMPARRRAAPNSTRWPACTSICARWQSTAAPTKSSAD